MQLKSNSLLLSCCILMMNVSVYAQIEFIATRIDTTTSKVIVARWTALDSNTTVNDATNLDTYLLGSSVFDAFSNHYYFRGTDSLLNGLTKYPLSGGALSINASDGVYNGGAQISMSTGKVYSLAPDTAGSQFAIYDCNLTTNTNTQLGVINESITLPVISESTCFDSNTELFYFVAYDSNAQVQLYRVAFSGSALAISKVWIPSASANYIIQKLHYDNNANKLYAMAVETNGSTGAITGHIITVNTTTGITTTLQSFTDYVAYQNGTSDFDQNTGTFIFVGLDSNYSGEMVLYNTLSGNVQKGYLPYGAHNIECDNYKFAKAKYAPAGLLNDETDEVFSYYPVPASDYLFLNMKDKIQPALYSLLNLDGQSLLRGSVTNGTARILLNQLSAGHYLIRVQQDKSTYTKEIIVE